MRRSIFRVDECGVPVVSIRGLGQDHGRRGLQHPPPRDHDGASLEQNRLPAQQSLWRPVAWTMPGARFVVAAESIVFGELKERPIPLSQMPQSRKPTRTVGGRPPTFDLRRGPRPVSSPGPRNTMDQTLMTPIGTEEKRHRYLNNK
jgi:hypothetical protein